MRDLAMATVTVALGMALAGHAGGAGVIQNDAVIEGLRQGAEAANEQARQQQELYNQQILQQQRSQLEHNHWNIG